MGLMTVAMAPVGHADEWIPEEPGSRGLFFGANMGLLLGTAVADTGDRAGTYVGQGVSFRFGEEVLPGFTLGLAFGFGGGTGADFEASGGAVFLQAGIRPLSNSPQLQLIVGTGLGGGKMSPTEEEGPEASTGGAAHQVGLTYEFWIWKGPNDGLTLEPMLEWVYLPPFGDIEDRLSQFSIGIATTWYVGR